MVGVLILVLDSVIDGMHNDSIGETLDTIRSVVGVCCMDSRAAWMCLAVFGIMLAVDASQVGGYLPFAGRRQSQSCGYFASHPAALCIAAVEHAALSGRVLELERFGDGDAAEPGCPVREESFDRGDAGGDDRYVHRNAGPCRRGDGEPGAVLGRRVVEIV